MSLSKKNQQFMPVGPVELAVKCAAAAASSLAFLAQLLLTSKFRRDAEDCCAVEDKTATPGMTAKFKKKDS